MSHQLTLNCDEEGLSPAKAQHCPNSPGPCFSLQSPIDLMNQDSITDYWMYLVGEESDEVARANRAKLMDGRSGHAERILSGGDPDFQGFILKWEDLARQVMNEQLHFPPRVALLAITYMDRFLIALSQGLVEGFHRENFGPSSLSTAGHDIMHAVTVACYQLACKLDERDRYHADVMQRVAPASMVYPATTIAYVERLVCAALEWQLWIRTPHCAIETLLGYERARSVAAAVSNGLNIVDDNDDDVEHDGEEAEGAKPPVATPVPMTPSGVSVRRSDRVRARRGSNTTTTSLARLEEEEELDETPRLPNVRPMPLSPLAYDAGRDGVLISPRGATMSTATLLSATTTTQRKSTAFCPSRAGPLCCLGTAAQFELVARRATTLLSNCYRDGSYRDYDAVTLGACCVLAAAMEMKQSESKGALSAASLTHLLDELYSHAPKVAEHWKATRQCFHALFGAQHASSTWPSKLCDVTRRAAVVTRAVGRKMTRPMAMTSVGAKVADVDQDLLTKRRRLASCTETPRVSTSPLLHLDASSQPQHMNSSMPQQPLLLASRLLTEEPPSRPSSTAPIVAHPLKRSRRSTTASVATQLHAHQQHKGLFPSLLRCMTSASPTEAGALTLTATTTVAVTTIAGRGSVDAEAWRRQSVTGGKWPKELPPSGDNRLAQ